MQLATNHIMAGHVNFACSPPVGDFTLYQLEGCKLYLVARNISMVVTLLTHAMSYLHIHTAMHYYLMVQCFV